MRSESRSKDVQKVLAGGLRCSFRPTRSPNSYRLALMCLLHVCHLSTNESCIDLHPERGAPLYEEAHVKAHQVFAVILLVTEHSLSDSPTAYTAIGMPVKPLSLRCKAPHKNCPYGYLLPFVLAPKSNCFQFQLAAVATAEDGTEAPGRFQYGTTWVDFCSGFWSRHAALKLSKPPAD